MKKLLKGILALATIGCFACGCFAQDEIAGTTEITGYYQQYRDFSFETGMGEYGINNSFAPTTMAGGGFSVARNLAEWFAVWAQLSFYGTVNQWADYGMVKVQNSVRIIHNLEGIRYQTKQYGPLRLYGKVGAGVVRYSLYDGLISDTKFSAGYGGGVNVWFSKNIGLTFDASHTLLALPNLEDLYENTKFQGREKWDSGMAYTTGLTFRF